MRPIVFTDLDDTLFQTARKMPTPPEEARRTTRALNGSHSYMTGPQAHMLAWLLETTRLIPVTARSTETMERVSVPFSDYRICSNGAVILAPDGVPDAAWQARTQAIAHDRCAMLSALTAAVAAHDPAGAFRCWIVEEAGCGIYFCVKSNGEAERLDDIEGVLRGIVDDDMIPHRNDNNLSFTPRELTKSYAVAHLLERLNADGDTPVFGMGDSLTDLPFMQLCDMMVVPRRSQVAAAMPVPDGWGHP
jgi:hydroxymethylpyrimidine pyrophosphatase-like HAD family hydrolase